MLCTRTMAFGFLGWSRSRLRTCVRKRRGTSISSYYMVVNPVTPKQAVTVHTFSMDIRRGSFGLLCLYRRRAQDTPSNAAPEHIPSTVISREFSLCFAEGPEPLADVAIPTIGCAVAESFRVRMGSVVRVAMAEIPKVS